MKNIITALGNPQINEELQKEKDCKVVTQDIQYQDGVIEILEKNGEINVLILNSILPGEKSLKEFINKIKEIKFNLEIIIILEKENEEIKNFLISKGIFNIFYNNKITIREIINLLIEKENKISDEINQEIKLLKEMILKNQFKNKRENNLINNTSKIINKINFKNIKIKLIKERLIKANKIAKNNFNKTICVIGSQGTGKTTFNYILSNIIKNKKIVLIDFDFLNNNISTIFGVPKLPKIINKKIKENKLKLNKINIEDLIININNNLNLICGLELLFENNIEINNNKIKNIINELLQKYDLILIDTPSEINNQYLKLIVENSNQLVLLIEPNLIGIKKSQKLLETYINKWMIKKEKINIIFNKYNINSISKLILNNLFSEFNISGEIKLNNKYDLIINKNKFTINKQIKKEYLNIINKLNLN